MHNVHPRIPRQRLPIQRQPPSATAAGSRPDEFAGIVSFQAAFPSATLHSDRIAPYFDSYEKFSAPNSAAKFGCK